MIVAGIDPGSLYSGVGIIEVISRRQARYIDHRVIRAQGEFSERMVTIYDELSTLLKHYQPKEVALEGIFNHKNAMSALKLGHARGVIMLCCQQHQATLHEYAPRLVKQTITGHGGSDKEHVQAMVLRLLNLHEPLPLDASDALAIALTHGYAMTSKLNNRSV